ncbi:hypothetical protein [Sulfitobacter dubius]|uniref:hypothetical protein n=1 Tax=Sulfitobacter dubius TaxID=218673 RepID=UPI001FACD417|nr:hypothetical protein [Sulfitobacter dubius]
MENSRDSVALADYPCLQRISWNRPDHCTVTRAEAFALYERNWRHIKDIPMDECEQQLFDSLVKTQGKGSFAS